MQNKIRYWEIAQIVDLYMDKYNIPVIYITRQESINDINDY